MPYFDSIFAAADATLDDVFADLAYFRANGQQVQITASVRSHAVGTDGDKTASETWIGYVVECHADELLIGTRQVKPIGGEEIAFPLPSGGSKVFLVTMGPNDKAWEPLDTINRKILIYCKFDRDE